MKHLHLDFETFSEVDITKVTTEYYVSHPSTEILMLAWGFQGEPVNLWLPNEFLPDELTEALFDDNTLLHAFNAPFEKGLLWHKMNIATQIERWRDTQIEALAKSFPASLDAVLDAVGLQKKDPLGKKLINRFSKPAPSNHKIRRYTKETHPEEWQQFCDYCIQDVEVETALHLWLNEVAPLSQELWEQWFLDRKINDKGLPVDEPMATGALQMWEYEKARIVEELKGITGLERITRGPFLHWLEAQDLILENTQKDTIQNAIKEANGPVKQALTLWSQKEVRAIDKYKVILNAATDGRLKGIFQFAGASRTMRWCLTGEHEVLTPEGWVRLDEWQGGHIAQWKDDGIIQISHANKVTFDYEGDMITASRDNRISAIMTPEHRLCTTSKNKTAGTAIWGHAQGIPRGGVLNRKPLVSTLNTRIIVMLQHDGCQRKYDTSWTFVKKRKYTRCQKLLASARIPYKATKYKNGRLHVRVKAVDAPSWLIKKDFGAWLLSEGHDPRAFTDEIQYWDGGNRRDKQVEVCAKKRINAEWTVTMAHLAGFAGTLSQRSNGYWFANITLSGNNVTIKPNDWGVQPFSGKVYCAVTSTGWFMVRHRGIIHITGNSGRTFQPQNLKRTMVPPEQIEALSTAITSGSTRIVKAFWQYPLSDLLGSAIRHAVKAEEGKVFVVSDLSSIESRVLGWITQCAAINKTFAQGKDTYKVYASALYGIPYVDVTKKQRNFSKPASLGCGYQLGVKGLMAYAEGYGVDMTEDQAEHQVFTFRELYWEVPAFWQWVTNACMDVTAYGGHYVGYFGLRIWKDTDFLYIDLPSGRSLHYYLPKNEMRRAPWGDDILNFTYMGLDITNRWVRINTHGGKLCIAENTEVLTDSGWKVIQEIAETDLVHDGVEFVNHGGLLYNGIKQTMPVDGVYMTPDHEVLTNEGWKTASEQPRPFRPNIRDAHCNRTESYGWKEMALDIPVPMWKRSDKSRVRGDKRGAERGNSELRMQDKRASKHAQDSWYVETQSLRGVSKHDRPMQASYTSGMGKLWRKGNSSLQKMANWIRKFLGRYGFFVPRRADFREVEQQFRVLYHQLLVGDSENSKLQSKGECVYQYTERKYGRIRSVKSVRDRENDNLLPNSASLVGGQTTNTCKLRQSRVYDISNCGKRKRFVVKGEEGPFIVHNCENIVQALARDFLAHGLKMADDKGLTVVAHVHDEIICEESEENGATAQKTLDMCMAANPPWARDILLGAEGYIARRYMKQ